MPGTLDLLQRQLAVMRLCAHSGPQSFSMLRQHLGLPPSTVTRLLRCLEGAGLVQRRQGSYGLAPQATRLGLELLGHARPATAAEAVVADLARQTGASAVFWIHDAERLIVAAKHEVADGFHFLDRFAHRPIHTSAFGLVILAALPSDQQAQRLAAVPNDPRRLISKVDRQGIFAGFMPDEVGLWRVATAVSGHGGVAGAIGISRHRRPDAKMDTRDRRCVVAAARRLARELAE